VAISTNIGTLKTVTATTAATEFGPRVGKVQLYPSATAFNTAEIHHKGLAQYIIVGMVCHPQCYCTLDDRLVSR